MAYHYTCHKCTEAGREPGHFEMLQYEGAHPECPVCEAALEYDGHDDNEDENELDTAAGQE